ncbi:MAG: response regulator [Syntrophobacteraceae bacterium]
MTNSIPPLLLAHHDLNTAKLLAAQLVKEENVGVYLADTGSKVQELLRSTSPELVIATQELPDTTGLALFTHLRESYPNVIRILLVPGESDSYAVRALENGIIHHYLMEPVRAGVFVEIVRISLQGEGYEAFQSPLIHRTSEGFPSVGPFANEDLEISETTYDELSEPPRADVLPESSETSVPAETSSPSFSSDEVYRVSTEYDEFIRSIEPDIDTLPPKDLPEPSLEVSHPSEKTIEENTEDLALVDMEHIKTDTGSAGKVSTESIPSDESSTGQDQRLYKLEALRSRLAGEIDELRDTISKLQIEHEDLKGLLDENGRLSELTTRLVKGAGTMERNILKLQEEIDKLQNERVGIQPAAEGHALASRGPLSPAPHRIFQHALDPADVYVRAEELKQDLLNERQLKQNLEAELQDTKNDLSLADEKLAQARQNLEAVQEQSGKELQKYRQLCESLQQKLKDCEFRCGLIEREKIELSERINLIESKNSESTNSREKQDKPRGKNKSHGPKAL